MGDTNKERETAGSLATLGMTSQKNKDKNNSSRVRGLGITMVSSHVWELDGAQGRL
jgi:hypothetical protein